MLCPRLPFLPPRPKPGRGPSPGKPPFAPKSPLQGPRGSAEAPESPGASPFLSAGQRRADSPAPRRPQRRAVTRPLPFSAPQDYPSWSPRALRGGGGPARPRVLTPPQERRRPPQDEPSLGRRGEPRRVGACGRAWTRCPGRDPSSPCPAPALSSAVRAPVASGPRSQCPPAASAASAAAPRLPSSPRCVPIPAPTSAVAAPTSQVTAADKPGRALRGAPGGPLPATHTRRPLEPGAPRASIPGKRGEGGRREAGRPTSTQPSLRPRDPHPQALRARAPHTPAADCGMRLGRRVLAQPGEWALEFRWRRPRLGRGHALSDRSQPLIPHMCLSRALLSKAALAQRGRTI